MTRFAWALLAAALATFGVLVATRVRREPAKHGLDALEPASRVALEQLARRIGVEFEILADASDGGNIHHEGADLDDAARYVRWLADEWSDYPRCWFETARISRVRLCSNLRWKVQPRAAIPDFDGGAMYFDVAFGPDLEEYVRRVMHHEFYHSFDRFDDGELYADAAWSKLNPPGFTYGGGGVTRQSDPTTSLLATGTVGFVDDYATSGVEEDKAELFAILMYSPDELRPRVAGDPYLASKWDRLAELVARPCAGAATPLPRR